MISWRKISDSLITLGCVVVFSTFVRASEANLNVEGACFESGGETSIHACRQLLKKDADDLRIMKRLADLLVAEGIFDEALRVLDRARKKYPQNKRIAFSIKLTKSMEAEKLLFAEEESISIKTNEKKTRTDAKVNRLLCLRVKGERGLKACQEAIASYPGEAELYQAYGDLLNASGQKNEANKIYLLAKKLQPQVPAVAQKTADGIEKTVTERVDKPEEKTAKGTAKIANINVPADTGSIAGKLRELKNLYDQQLIDESECRQRKTALMDETFGQSRRKVVAGQGVKDEPTPSEDYGDYHALVIGVQNYRYLNRLEMANNDAKEVARLLEKDYGFKVEILEDPTRREILMALGKMRRTLQKNDNLLVYYAGHGWLDRDADTGYWMPVDAASDNDIDWLSLNSVTSAARAIQAKHLMIVADSCFSGKLTRGLNIKMKQADHISRMASRRTRVVLTSGGLEPVLDAGGGGHSVFAAAFLDILRENKKIIDGTTLFSRLRRDVMLKASQTPEYSDIRKAGHEGGDFLFVRVSGKNS